MGFSFKHIGRSIRRSIHSAESFVKHEAQVVNKKLIKPATHKLEPIEKHISHKLSNLDKNFDRVTSNLAAGSDILSSKVGLIAVGVLGLIGFSLVARR